MTTDTLKDLLHHAASEALNGLPDDPEAEVLQSTIGVVHSLVVDGRLAELALLLAVNFSAYYPGLPDLSLYLPINEN